MQSEKKLMFLRVIERGIVWILGILAIFSVLGLSFGSLSLQILTGIAFISLVLIIALVVILEIVAGLIKETVSFESFVENDRFNSLYDSSPIAYVTVERNGNVVRCNPAAVSLLNGTIDKVSMLNFFDVVLEHAGHDPSVLPSKVHAGVVLNDEELRLKTFDGSEVWVLASVYEDKRHRHHIFSMLDITESKKVDTAKSEFVALATHQLRTPVAAIRWNYELLRRKLPEDVRTSLEKYLAKISRNVNRMNALIDDFLSVSKLEMGTYATSEESIDLSVFYGDVLDEFAEKIIEKQLQVSRAEEPKGLTFTTDPGLLHIIVSNLVSNAVKYLQSGGSLVLAYSVSGSTLTITVSDNGIGIPAPEQEQLFTKFFRASNARSHHTEGTGLGLYIVKQSAEQLGGTIEVASVPNQRTTFTVTLPIRRS